MYIKTLYEGKESIMDYWQPEISICVGEKPIKIYVDSQGQK